MINQSSLPSDIRRIAIVGSGLAGLTAGIQLKQLGHDVTLFEKSRGPGGRLAAKRVTGGSADIGAQYFTARNPEFLPFLSAYAGEANFSVWQGRFGYRDEQGNWDRFPEESRYVGTPRMTAITRALSAHVPVVAETRIERLERERSQWTLVDTAGNRHEPFDQVIITAPPAQARALMTQSDLTDLASHLDDPVQRVLPCWAVAAHFAQPPWSRHEGMRVRHPVLYWIANNSSKPGREESGQWWVLHAGPEWTADHVDTPPEQVATQMIEAFRELAGFQGEPDAVVTHRWLYARSEDGERPGHLWFADHNLGVAGDWLDGGRVEGAFNSARSLVAAMVASA